MEYIVSAIISWQLWLTLGLFLIFLEIFDGHGIALTIGISFLILSSIIGVLNFNGISMEWQFALLTHSLILAAIAILLRYLTMYNFFNNKDINKY